MSDVPNFAEISLMSSTMPASTVTSSAVVGSSSKQQLRVRQQRHGDHHALLLTARDLVRVGIHDPLRVGQAHRGEHLSRALERFLARHAFVIDRHFGKLLAELHRRIRATPSAPGRPWRSSSRECGAALPASWCACRALRSRISPPTMPPFFPMKFMMASATVDLPQPDSPTMPCASPGMSLRLKSTTAGISPARV